MNRKELVVYVIINEILEIVMKENPEIVQRAIIQTVDKNPEIFKDALEKVKKGKDENNGVL